LQANRPTLDLLASEPAPPKVALRRGFLGWVTPTELAFLRTAKAFADFFAEVLEHGTLLQAEARVRLSAPTPDIDKSYD